MSPHTNQINDPWENYQGSTEKVSAFSEDYGKGKDDGAIITNKF
jgi:hypothetical protein